MKNQTQQLTNWTMLLTGIVRNDVLGFIKGEVSRRAIERKLRFSNLAGVFRSLVYTHGTEKARKLGNKAARRRNLI